MNYDCFILEAAEDKQQEVPPTASTSAESIPPAPVVCTSGLYSW